MSVTTDYPLENQDAIPPDHPWIFVVGISLAVAFIYAWRRHEANRSAHLADYESLAQPDPNTYGGESPASEYVNTPDSPYFV